MTNSQQTQILPIFVIVLFMITSSSKGFRYDHDLEDPLANMSLDLDLDPHTGSATSSRIISPKNGQNNNFWNLLNYDNDHFFHLMAPKLGRAASSSSSSSSGTVNVRVDDYGAKANGGDDTQAFMKAWKVACVAPNGVLIVSNNKVYNVKPITFQGPCKSTTTLKVYGTIKASTHSSAYKKDEWLVFQNVQNLRVEGGGIINGNGQVWWPKSCKINKKLRCKRAPTAMTFYECNNVQVSDITIKNAQQMHITFHKCMNVKAFNLMVVSPGNSPNTDGIHVSETQNMVIQNCVIGTGDDCISIVSGSKNVRATDITCGPGHGISIGSLGAGNSEAHVSNIYVNRAKFSGSTNGVRIKTWQGGSGYATNIMFENIVMNNVANPVIIDQNYCDRDGSCPQKGSAVQISNIIYRNIKGTSASDVAMKFDCSKRFPCRGIQLQDIHLSLVNKNHGKSKASCSNVNFGTQYKINPTCS